MNLTNKQIRARARELLDGNIFGKDWIKSVFLMILMNVIILVPSYLIYTPVESIVSPALHSVLDQSLLVNQVIADVIILYIELIIIALISNLLAGPLMVGFSSVHLDLVRNGDNISVRKFFNGFKNELKHKRGVLSMARSQSPNSAGSQFFIMHQDAKHLDKQYAAFGKVTSGMETVDAIASTKTNFQDRPLTEQKISSITVEVNMPSEVKVYSNNGRGYQLVGQYSNIEHSQELSFFAPEDANDFRVSVNGKTLSTTNGGKVKFE